MEEKLTPKQLIEKSEEMKNTETSQFQQFAEEQRRESTLLRSAFDFSEIPMYEEKKVEPKKEEPIYPKESEEVSEVRDNSEFVSAFPDRGHTRDVNKVSSMPSFSIIKELPSRGLSYPPGTEISYRPYSFGEAKKLSQSKFSMKEHLDFVLNGVYVQGLKSKYDITYFDFLFISLLRRISTVQTKTVNITFKCRHCEANNTYQISVNDFEFEDSQIPKLPIRVNIRGKELKFSYLTLGKFLEAYKHNDVKNEMALLAYSVINMPFKEAYSIISDENLPFDDGAVLDVVEDQLFHGLKPKEFLCQKGDCGKVNLVNLEVLQMSITPFRGDEDTYRNRIHYGD